MKLIKFNDLLLQKILYLVIMSFFYLLPSFAFQTQCSEVKKQTIENTKKRLPQKYYEIKEREHSFSETFKHIGIMYGITWAVYPASQPDIFIHEGSFENYKRNFGQIVFDKDGPFWNWLVHPLSGSQLFLYYRANGYTRINSLALAFVSSTLFEFTVEIYTEPASVQDLYQTPILGSVLGVGIESLSLFLLNSGNKFGKTLAHVINPWTMFDFFNENMMVVPRTNYKDKASLNLMVRF